MVGLLTITCLSWILAIAFAFKLLKIEDRMLREKLEHAEQMKLFGKIAYHHGFVDGGMRVRYDYDREYPKIKEHFKEKMGDGE